ncbi:MAG TPA: amidohydrolase family protein, partial [Blastocatellia bacterium]|nr:amidohydrolase family protein [Blastocatellia bacterium]
MRHSRTRIVLLVVIALLPLAPLGAQTPEIFDVVIMNGRIVDGTGNPWFYGSVGIRGDKIVKVGHIGASRARRRIDARGMIVAPGFVDMLGQSELSLLVDPRAQSKIFQGITTEVTGEGGSIAPLNDYTKKQIEPFLKHYKITADWNTLGQYFDRLQRSGTAINLATYVGAAQVRQCILHDDDRAPTAAELEQMRKLVAQAMQDGAMGVSTALIYAPGYYAKTDELIELAKVAAKYGGNYATHMRNEGDSEMPAIDEALRIGKEAALPVEIFHLKVSGKQNWGTMKDVLKKIEGARTAGIDVAADQYPYTAGATSLGASIPPWAHEGGDEKLLARLQDPATREKIKQEMRAASDQWENLYVDVGGGAGTLVSGVLNRSLAKYEGHRISEIAQMMGKSDEIDALIDLVIADGDQTSAIYFMASEDDVKLALQQPWVSVGIDHGEVATDGPLAEGNAHPRGYGSFPRILGRYVRDEHLLSLEQAIRKMTSLAANRAHLTGR